MSPLLLSRVRLWQEHSLAFGFTLACTTNSHAFVQPFQRGSSGRMDGSLSAEPCNRSPNRRLRAGSHSSRHWRKFSSLRTLFRECDQSCCPTNGLTMTSTSRATGQTISATESSGRKKLHRLLVDLSHRTATLSVNSRPSWWWGRGDWVPSVGAWQRAARTAARSGRAWLDTWRLLRKTEGESWCSVVS